MNKLWIVQFVQKPPPSFYMRAVIKIMDFL